MGIFHAASNVSCSEKCGEPVHANKYHLQSLDKGCVGSLLDKIFYLGLYNLFITFVQQNGFRSFILLLIINNR